MKRFSKRAEIEEPETAAHSEQLEPVQCQVQEMHLTETETSPKIPKSVGAITR